MNEGSITVNGYRDGLFEKFGVKIRVWLFLYAVRMEAGMLNLNFIVFLINKIK